MSTTVPSADYRPELEAVIAEAYRLSADAGTEVERVLKAGREQPLDRATAVRLLTTVIEVLQAGAKKRGKAVAGVTGDTGSLVESIIQAREKVQRLPPASKPVIDLLSLNRVDAGDLHPDPWFHETRVPMRHGYVRTADLGLWEKNDRLDIHLRQFEQQRGRKPDKGELLQVMLSRMALAGTEADEFNIVHLADNIAVNGVRTPPILDLDGTPLDGNRRIAACQLILSSDDYDEAAKKRVEHIYVWQLTGHATDDDRRAVVVSLNFEDDCKEEWRPYIKAKKVYEDWQAMLLRESLRTAKPGAERTREMVAELSKKYALGDPNKVRLYIKMMEMAEEYKDYHIGKKGRDEFEVEHAADRDFQYFDELSKGSRAGVAYVLEQDESDKHLVYDLLYDQKFSSWKVVRDLKYLDEEVRAELKKAREMPSATDDDQADAQDFVERVLTAARDKSKQNKVGNPNIRIESFVKWLRGVGIDTLQEGLRPDVKQRLRDALAIAVQVMDHGAAGEGE